MRTGIDATGSGRIILERIGTSPSTRSTFCTRALYGSLAAKALTCTMHTDASCVALRMAPTCEGQLSKQHRASPTCHVLDPASHVLLLHSLFVRLQNNYHGDKDDDADLAADDDDDEGDAMSMYYKVHSITRYSIGLLTLVSLMLFVSLMRNGTFGVHMHIPGFGRSIADEGLPAVPLIGNFVILLVGFVVQSPITWLKCDDDAYEGGKGHNPSAGTAYKQANA
ncbi:hypothetical protein K449DRAFT_433838 [Hypoxylon sp. EC38]|nr:hypothetical protein K449DRAFT_433838 [Hypoxylon sp. EC38]